MNTLTHDTDTRRRNKRSGLYAALLVLGMLALGYASVPLYRIFCQVTGFAGTTQVADAAEAETVQVADTTMSIRFDSNVSSALPWTFRPENVTDTVSVGARDLAIFLATNNSDEAVTGSAVFNVTPLQAGKYFNKIQCFCFSEQTSAPASDRADAGIILCRSKDTGGSRHQGHQGNYA